LVQFSRLRISGFKSFVDPTELEIENGLTGVVGPNGCGKSNILEALRWCMGEGSARQLRGGGMDDVIFNGTTDRPSRNIAEVVLQLDNSERNAPAAFNEFDQIEVIRRIERESGSSYKVNGRDVRARDVQLLFADISTGARSTAIVSQGRIGAIINAKPADRRLIIEEAAGITGLHSRRHEAELRLRAAETNLGRLEDVVSTLSTQMQGLKRQTRQANRYRNISGEIRKTEAVLLYIRWSAATEELTSAQTALAEIVGEVNRLTAETARSSTAVEEESSKVPPLREKEAEAAAALHRQLVERDTLDAEEQRLNQRRSDLQSRLVQIEADIEREAIFSRDADEALEGLGREQDDLQRAQENAEAVRSEAAAALDKASGEAESVEAEVTELTQKVASGEAERVGVDHRISDLRNQLQTLERRVESSQTELAALAEKAGDDRSAEIDAAVNDAEANLAKVRGAADDSEVRKTETEQVADDARNQRQEVEETVSRLRAEQDALRAVLAEPEDEDGPPVVSLILSLLRL
jgi:chromosome segregation protein